jgi:hypothetical protein
MILELNKEMAWVTFLNDGWEQTWIAVTDENDVHLEFHSEDTMNICRSQFGHTSFGIAQTSQMILGNSVRDNF